jgi:hypothetical protein
LAQAAFEIDVIAGDNRQVDFKLVPQVRAIEFVGETMLIAAPAKPQDKLAPTGTTTITGKPQTAPITIRPEEPITAKPRQQQQPRSQSPSRDPRQQQP